MVKEVRIKKIREEAESVFHQGGFYCSEAIVHALRTHLAPEMPEALVAAASGFPVGVGRSQCMCGAISGAVICLGYFFGRSKPTSPNDPNSQKCLALAHELQESFRQNHRGMLCCHIHVKGLDMQKGEHRPQCIAFTGEMAQKTAEIIARELHLKHIDGEA